MQKLYHIKTWGCQMNVYDSIRISEILMKCGYQETQDQTLADIIILNTCHIREKASEKVFSDLGRIRKLKERRQEVGKGLIVGVAGCVAQAEGEQILKRAPVVDLVFGPQTWHKLPEMLTKVQEEGLRHCDTDFPVEEKFEKLPEEIISSKRIHNSSAFLAIQEGCDKFCTYCVVPYTRGVEYSRPVMQVISEAIKLVEKGAKEITLLGQNVNAYHGLNHDGKTWSLGLLIKELSKIKKLERIRYTTSYPAEVDDDLIAVHKDVEKLIPFLHLPIQSGSDKILKAMNRKHTREQYLETIEKIKSARADMSFSTDIIVGFPNESDEDFADTLDIVKKVGFIQSFCFIYSKRPGTPAALMEDNIPLKTKEERLAILQDTFAQIQKEFNKQTVGKEFKVLLDRTSKHQSTLIGRSPYMQPVYIETNEHTLGDIVNVKILKSSKNNLEGIVLK